jgi:hypothetical protein
VEEARFVFFCRCLVLLLLLLLSLPPLPWYMHPADARQYQPLSAFLILFTPEILLIFIWVSLVYLEFYSVL